MYSVTRECSQLANNMKSIFLSILGLALILISFTLKSVDMVSFIIPIILGVVYLLFGMGIIPMSQKLKIILISASVLIVSILMFVLDSHINNVVWAVRDSMGNPITTVGRSFWFTQAGVCTEGTICWLWGQFLPPVLAVIFLIYGMIKVRKLSSIK